MEKEIITIEMRGKGAANFLLTELKHRGKDFYGPNGGRIENVSIQHAEVDSIDLPEGVRFEIYGVARTKEALDEITMRIGTAFFVGRDVYICIGKYKWVNVGPIEYLKQK